MTTDDGGPARALTPEEKAPISEGKSRLSVAEVKLHLRILLAAERVTDETAREAEAQLQRIAAACGTYRTATEIHSLVTGTSPLGSRVEKYFRGRGSELAGELFFLHLQRELDSLDADDKSLGPSVYKVYCDELFDCFFRSDHVRKGVGFPIMLMERLAGKAAISTGSGKLYLTLADQGLQSAVTLSRQKFERDKLKERRASRLYKRGETPPPKKKGEHLVLPVEVLTYLESVHQKFSALKDAFSKNAPLPGPSRDITPGAQLEHLRGLLTQAEEVDYRGITALLKETIGTLLATAQPNQAGALLFAAAREFEDLADQENALLFIKMSSRRYRRAHKLYTVTKSTNEATRVKSKILEMKSLYDNELLAIAQL